MPVPDDPFDTLGLSPDASADEVRGACKLLAKVHHPDRGGDADVMRQVNAAAAAALRRLDQPTGVPPTGVPPTGPSSTGTPSRTTGSRPTTGDGVDEQPGEWTGITSDVPSFTVEALPADTFEAIAVVATWLGDVLDDDPPYRLDVHLADPLRCWCRLELVPDAGATTVSIAIGAVDGAPLPAIEVVRDVWVDGLNQLDWGDDGPHGRR